MRDKIIPQTKQKIVKEAIHAYTHDINSKRVTVAVGIGEEKKGVFVFDIEQSFETIKLDAELYTDLMAENGGNLAPILGKPAGTFRPDDMWYFIDKKRASADEISKNP